MALVMAFSTAKNENRHLDDLPQAAVGCVPERISSVGEDKVSNWEFWFFLNFFYSFLFLFLFWIFIFIRLLNRFFWSVKGYCTCLYDKQNNTWLLVDMELFFSNLGFFGTCTVFPPPWQQWTKSFNLWRELHYQCALVQ